MYQIKLPVCTVSEYSKFIECDSLQRLGCRFLCQSLICSKTPSYSNPFFSSTFDQCKVFHVVPQGYNGDMISGEKKVARRSNECLDG